MDSNEKLYADIYYSCFIESEGIGTRVIQNLIDKEAIDSIRSLNQLAKEDYAKIDSLCSSDFDKLDSALRAREKILMDTEASFEIARVNGITSVSVEDEEYPLPFRQLSGMPKVIYCKGRRELLSKVSTNGSVSIVGTRGPSSYATYATKDFSTKLSNKGIVIVSGLALGIDRVAHSSCIEAKGDTIAVLAGGPDNTYPLCNKDIYEIICKRGLVVSERKPGTKAVKQYFPSRNRLISALSDACLVMEAGVNSGTLHTASFAAAQGKEVFVLPNSIYYENNMGGHMLVSDGANILYDISHVIDSVAREVFYRKLGSFPTELDNINSTNSMIKELRCKLLRNSDALTSENYKVLLCDELTIRPMDSDELASSLKLPFSKLSVLLSELEVEHRIQMIKGKYILTFR
ncbi:MAG TPA: DNA-processing protein DprA [Saccharofermentans sp.]|nr:DNA-processing protein DprA [Saccharofermentans sp.]